MAPSKGARFYFVRTLAVLTRPSGTMATTTAAQHFHVTQNDVDFQSSLAQIPMVPETADEVHSVLVKSAVGFGAIQ